MWQMSQYTDLDPNKGHIWGSDYEHFEAKGHVVIGAYDGSVDSSYYHSATDTLEIIDWNYLTSVTKMVLATITTLDKENNLI